MFDEAELKDNIDFLSPFGTTLVNKRDEEDGSYNCSELLKEYGPDDEDTNETFRGDGDQSGFVSHVTTTLDGDLEDIIAEELPQGPISSEVMIEGKKMGKPAALRKRLQHHLNRASTDGLRRVEEVPCFNSSDGK